MDTAGSAMAMDPLGLAALGLVALDWLALGWLSGLAWPPPTSSPGLISQPGPISPSGPSGRPISPAPPAVPRAAAVAATWALRLLVGAFLVAYAQLLLALAGIGFGTTALVLLVAAVLALGLRLAGHRPRLVAAAAPRRNGHAPASSPAAPAWRERLGWLLLGGVLLAATVHALLVPEAGWDAYSHWGLRALAAAQAGRLVDTGTVHEYYPPLVPLLEAFLYRQRAMASIDLGKDLWPLVGSAFAICLAWHLRLLLGQPQRWLAPYLATAVVLGTTQLLEDFATGQADLALCAFLSLASLAALQALRDPQQARPWLIQTALFAAAAALSKYEGPLRVAVVVVAVAIEATLARRQARAGAGPVAVAAGVCVCLALGALGGYAPWLVFGALHGIAPSAEHLSVFQPQTIGAVAVALVAVLGGLRTGGGVLVVMLAAALAGRDALRPPTRLLALIVLGQAAATLLAFLLSDTPPDVEVRTAATRLIEQFLPLGLAAAGLWLAAAAEARPVEAPKPEPIIATTGR